MLTINLEKELIKQNKKLMVPSELLAIKEYERNAGMLENDALERVGLTAQLKKGKEIKDRLNTKREETQKFKQERVFHISQIESLCRKYDLRFLQSKSFKGQVDPELAHKIVNFEAAYDVKCGEPKKEQPKTVETATSANDIWRTAFQIPLISFAFLEDWDVQATKPGRTYIAAPESSFALQERPVDPLFFYAINDEYFYLIHKWGNDLSVFRRVIGWWRNEFRDSRFSSFQSRWRSPFRGQS